MFFEPPDLKEARAKMQAHLARHRPKTPFVGPVRFINKWLYSIKNKAHTDGDWKITRPDTDNMVKLLKDVMADLGFWSNDAHVASEITEKFWSDTPGIFIQIEELTNEQAIRD